MEQNITLEHLEELSEVGRSKLYKWWHENKKHGDKFTYLHDTLGFKKGEEYIYGYYPVAGDQYPLLSIGQMIEFLEHKGEMGQILHLLHWTGEACAWRVLNRQNIPAVKMGLKRGEVDFIELRDALWQAVREALEAPHSKENI